MCLKSINSPKLQNFKSEPCLELPTKLAFFVFADQYLVNTPGRLLLGYGREVPQNQFHGGAPFHDTATGLVLDENQVSIGAGETLMSRKRFEQ